jgi:hypothetical protein
MMTFLFLVLPTLAYTQSDSLKRIQDTTYIQSLSDQVMFKLDLENDIDEYKISGSDFKYDIRPNLGASKILSFTYRWLYLGIAYLPRIVNENNHAQKGETKGFGISSAFTTPNWLADIQYKKVKGFYLHNTDDYVPNWNPDTDDYVQFPDLNTWMIRGLVMYKLNPNFSIRALHTQVEAQRKSAHSFAPGMYFNYYVIDNTKATATGQKASTLQAIIQPNYYGTWVIKKYWYLAGGVGAGAGFYHTWLQTELVNGDINESTFSDFMVRLYTHAGMGYNGKRLIAGGEVLYHETFANQPDNTAHMEFTRLTYQVFVGYRFRAPRWLARTLDMPKKIVSHK